MSRQSPRPGVKRVYEPPEALDGMELLVDRIWPRGLTKEHAGVDLWLKDVARVPASGSGLTMTRTAGVSFRSDTWEFCATHAAVDR